MPSIRPFKGIIYNKKKIADASKVVAPPYDVISAKMQDELYKKHANNVVRLILGKINNTDSESDNRYTRARDFFKIWLNEDILIEDEEPSIYIYSQKYKYSGKSIERFGFISLMELDLENKGSVLPHENTLAKPKADRLNLMRSVNANLSPIFMLYSDSSHKVAATLKNFSKKSKPFIDINADGVRNRVWKLSNPAAIERIEKFMADKNIFIADGHHRYETAVNYAKELENRPDAWKELKDNSKYFMGYFCEIDDRTLTILPTHRVIKDMGNLKKEDIIKRLKNFFAVEKIASGPRLLKRLSALKKSHAFGMYLGKKEFYAITLKKEGSVIAMMGKNSRDWKSLDVAILHLFILQNLLRIRDEDDNIEYVKDPEEALGLVSGGRFKTAFLLNPTKVEQVKKVAQHGEKMPKKSTYFYPKPLSGLVIRKM